MPVRRDSNGRFAGGSGGSSKRASRASKKMGAVKPRTASTDRSKVTTSKVAGKGRVGQTASKVVRTQGAANQVKAAKFDTASRDQAMSKRVNMNKKAGLAGAASRKASFDRSPDRVKGGLKKAANVAGRDAIKAEGLKAITGERRYKRKNRK
ncbi:hypothetical protein SEA_JAYCOOKIE_8 [Arthrobacter phage JayCookie]|uniref:Uncharacterized protein n=3 Tax=Klausavirus princesstrina TaxID=1984784 RepID=A0A0U4B535_9CAUD|nr:hypothetical protein FDI82_gp008 [Arthrobacter phage PrincessTrina]ALY09854.1 hypothetical protein PRINCESSTRINA_8 [Arthrobacter phage PrincessTrina]ASZ73219.1 hypothetical protein SEA_JAYCOOKIE_8 [Arthrobacter phage JayCookie]QEQ94509.1 hypothetical protein SEA_LINUS_8 [Arthrobacter phage Linus]